MSRYIDADKLSEYIQENGVLGSGYSQEEIESDVLDMIDAQPTADVKEIIHGRWIWDDFLLRCTICGVMYDYRYNFCPHCGADMRGKHK